MCSYKQTSVYENFLSQKALPNQDIFEQTSTPISQALKVLETIVFNSEDIKSIENLISTIPFKNGQEAIDYANKEKIKIIFDKVSSPEIHAQWQNWRNTIVINERYQNTKDSAEICAISAAILHELSHAKDKDSISSIQEEIDCLAMNAIAFKILQKQKPELSNKNNSPILSDGVTLYSKLFFDKDKSKLADRIKLKYGSLDIESPNHTAKEFAKEIKKRGI